MTKSVYIGHEIILAGADVSKLMNRWSIDAEIGHLNEVTLELTHDPSVITVMEMVKAAGPYLATKEADGMIRVKGVDITKWVTAMEFVRFPGEFHRIRLKLAADPTILKINGGYPWLPPAEYPKVNLLKPGPGTVTYALS